MANHSIQHGPCHMRTQVFINYEVPKRYFTFAIMTVITTCHLAPLGEVLTGNSAKTCFHCCQRFHCGPGWGMLMPVAGCHHRRGLCFPLMPAATPHLALYKHTSQDERTGWTGVLTASRRQSFFSSPAAGLAFPPELPAWISRPPACLSWPTESYPIPENLPINSRVTRASRWRDAHLDHKGTEPKPMLCMWDLPLESRSVK